jgi:serine/threonine protein kinase
MAEMLAAAPKPSTSDADEHDYPLIGETLGLWRLVSGLGRGGMGEVYEAEYDYVFLLSLSYAADQRLVIRKELQSLSRPEQARLAGEMLGTPLPPDARFAIKVCNARTGTPGHKRFLQEAEMAQRLGDHPYIVSVHALNMGGIEANADATKFLLERGKYKDVAFMVMDLAARDYDHGKLSLAEAVHIVRCIATALDHAHSNGIIHRDLKPENILGTISHPLLTDFGIAKEIDQTHGLTRTGQIIGTLDYMSPEQSTDAKRVDHRSDIYSLGVVLYEFATQGCLPYFHKMDRESCLAAIRSERVQPRWPREYKSDFPVGLERIILKAMAHRMEDRYQAMSEFITDLDRFSRHEWLPFWGRVKVKAWMRYQVRRHPRILWGSIGALSLALIAALVFWLPWRMDNTRREFDNKLDVLEKVVRKIERRDQSQLSKNEAAETASLATALAGAADRYRGQKDRYGELSRRLLGHRWLEATFSGTRRNSAAPISTEECIAAKERLTLAANAQSQLWNLSESGLNIQERVELTLEPYGTGTIYCLLQVKTCEGFHLKISEAVDRARHSIVWQIKGGILQLVYQEDEKAPVTLHQEILPEAQRFVQRRIGIELRPDGMISWWPTKHVHDGYPGLSDGTPASIKLDLPKDSVLSQIEIWPEKSP